MKIRKAKKSDLNQYVNLVTKSNKEYQKITGRKIKFTEKGFKKEFKEFLLSKKRFLLVSEDNKQIVGYIIGTLNINIYRKTGYIDDIFVIKSYRKKGTGTLLIRELEKLFKKNKCKYYRLGVNPKNKKAMKLYKKLGFKITHYDMEKIIK